MACHLNRIDLKLISSVTLIFILTASCKPLSQEEKQLIGFWACSNGHNGPHFLELRADRTALLITFDPSILDYKTTEYNWSLTDSLFSLGNLSYARQGFPDSLNLKKAPFIESYDNSIFKRLESGVNIESARLTSILESKSWSLQNDSIYLVEFYDKRRYEDKKEALKRELLDPEIKSGFFHISTYDWWTSAFLNNTFINVYQIIDSQYYGQTEQVLKIRPDTLVTYSFVDNKRKTYIAKQAVNVEEKTRLLTGKWVATSDPKIDTTRGFPYINKDEIFKGKVFMELAEHSIYNFDLDGHIVHGDERWALNRDGSIVMVSFIDHDYGDTTLTEFHNIETFQEHQMRLRTESMILTEHGFFYIGEYLDFKKTN
jgi:hypothetical protein